jgi:hypothetical protein
MIGSTTYYQGWPVMNRFEILHGCLPRCIGCGEPHGQICVPEPINEWNIPDPTFKYDHAYCPVCKEHSAWLDTLVPASSVNISNPIFA